MYRCTLSLTSKINGVGGQLHGPAALPARMTSYPLYQEARRAPGPVWIHAENLALTVIRSPDRLVRITLWY